MSWSPTKLIWKNKQIYKYWQTDKTGEMYINVDLQFFRIPKIEFSLFYLYGQIIARGNRSSQGKQAGDTKSLAIDNVNSLP